MSTCGCGTYGYDPDYDGDAATIWREARVGRTKVVHACVECGNPIPTGSRCCRVTALADGQWMTLYRCAACAAIAELAADILKFCFALLLAACTVAFVTGGLMVMDSAGRDEEIAGRRTMCAQLLRDATASDSLRIARDIACDIRGSR